jgi:hypothetical protein
VSTASKGNDNFLAQHEDGSTAPAIRTALNMRAADFSSDLSRINSGWSQGVIVGPAGVHSGTGSA